MKLEIMQIATIYTDFDEKFGIPRQSLDMKELKGEIVFEPEFRNPDALRGIEGYSHLWLIWCFSENLRDGWSATVRPPRLGGNERRGVFATRAPFRPNLLGMSVIELESVELDSKRGPVLHVLGADILNGTPIFDIKPYIASDCVANARTGFSVPLETHLLQVELSGSFLKNTKLTNDKLTALKAVLSQDPRPAYQDDPERIYGIRFAGEDIHFTVSDNILQVL